MESIKGDKAHPQFIFEIGTKKKARENRASLRLSIGNHLHRTMGGAGG
jgi:hypothetical protein